MMNRVWARAHLYMQLLLRRGKWRAMNLLLWKDIRNRVVCMGIWLLQPCQWWLCCRN